MEFSSGTIFNLKRGEVSVFSVEVTLQNDDTIRGLIDIPGFTGKA